MIIIFEPIIFKKKGLEYYPKPRIIPCSTSLIAFEPTWNHLCIDSHLRHFVRFISRTKGFAFWTALNRNKKYLSHPVHWPSVFTNLNDIEDLTSTTSLKSSNQKINKVKFLAEELPTLHLLQHRLPSIYMDHWNCLQCHASVETFNDIWTCPQVSPITQGIRNR